MKTVSLTENNAILSWYYVTVSPTESKVSPIKSQGGEPTGRLCLNVGVMVADYTSTLQTVGPGSSLADALSP